MSSGVIGGIIGSKISDFFGKKYGKKKAYFWTGLVTAIIGLLITGAFLTTPIVRTSDYEKVELEFDDVWLRDGYRSFEIIFEKGSNKYELNRSMWKDNYEASNLLRYLKDQKEATLWIKRSESNYKIVRGLETGNIFLSPEHGTELDNGNRKAGFLLGGLFIVLGLGGIYSSRIKKY
ncbi:hypothetical protein [Fodinibius salsisoli]|uniref:DUF3592 domain-containing protein n=1 Tax=Fodinibius salsisoli TaxID=2820877 RepID=A0ABT3PQC3_9BACT|nr:hypothetical protein [Fodinibius salsisoli]MCW9708050.1 hypothetical protein [Fodinibius salsisoli]